MANMKVVIKSTRKVFWQFKTKNYSYTHVQDIYKIVQWIVRKHCWSSPSMFFPFYSMFMAKNTVEWIEK